MAIHLAPRRSPPPVFRPFSTATPLVKRTTHPLYRQGRVDGWLEGLIVVLLFVAGGLLWRAAVVLTAVGQ